MACRGKSTHQVRKPGDCPPLYWLQFPELLPRQVDLPVVRMARGPNTVAMVCFAHENVHRRGRKPAELVQMGITAGVDGAVALSTFIA